MAIRLQDKETTDPPSSDYPFGDIRDDPGDRTGTKVNKRNHADFHQFFAKLMDLAGLAYNDLPDNDYSGFQYIDALLMVIQNTLGVMRLMGNIDASTNPNYPAGEVGDVYVITVAGKVGGVSGKSVDVGDLVVCKIANAGGDEAAVGVDWFVVEHNLQKASQAEVDAGVEDTKYITSAKIAGATDIIGKQQADDGVFVMENSNANLNTFQESAIVFCTQAASNAPDTSGSGKVFEVVVGHLIISSAVIVYQKATQIDGTGVGRIWSRNFNITPITWSVWTLINNPAA